MENSDEDKREVFFLPDGLLDELDELPKVTVEENVLARTDGTSGHVPSWDDVKFLTNVKRSLPNAEPEN